MCTYYWQFSIECIYTVGRFGTHLFQISSPQFYRHSTPVGVTPTLSSPSHFSVRLMLSTLSASNSNLHTHWLRFDFVSAPLFHPRYKREYFLQNYSRPGPTTRSDKVITSSDWSTLVVAKLSPWIQLDSKDETVRRLSEKVIVWVV